MNLDLIQNNAIDKLSKLRAGALFMKMGTGKTKVAIDLIKSKIENIDIIAWIAPASLINETSYIDEIKKWCGFMDKIKFFTVESVSQSDDKYLELIDIADKNRCFCVLDESIKIKNLDSKRTKRLLENYSKFDFRLILNGTPTTKNILDLLPQINFISPKILNMNESQFANTFLEYYEDGYKPWRRWSKPHNESALVEIIRPYIFDADLDISVKLIEKPIEIKLNTSEINDYNAEKESYFKSIYNIDFLAMTQKFQKLYTICDDKYLKLKDILNNNEQFLIFVKYLDEVDILKKLLPKAREFTGREKANITDFKDGKYNYLICTYGTGAFGLNLQFCNNIIFLSQTFDYKDKVQALHRVYRTGQVKDVTVYDFYVNTGLESIIKKSLEKKENTLNNLKKIIDKEGYKVL